ncbi:MAG: type 1 glutamine amidotransferase [Pikeienuella sp.]
MKALAILDCVSPDALTAKYGPCGGVVADWLSPHLPDAALVRFDLPGGDVLPIADAFDGYVISGSEKGVYDETPWMEPLRQFLLDVKAAGKPVFGICFGHQIMADVYGGKAEKVDKGFIAGAQSFDLAGQPIKAHVAHQDQVTVTPPNAHITASAPYCPVAALAYDFPALSVQFHPEYRDYFVGDLIDMFGDEMMTAEQIVESKTSLTGDVPVDLFGTEVAAFFGANT